MPASLPSLSLVPWTVKSTRSRSYTLFLLDQPLRRSSVSQERGAQIASLSQQNRLLNDQVAVPIAIVGELAILRARAGRVVESARTQESCMAG